VEPFEPPELAARDAIVVLGCRIEQDGRLSHAAARRARGGFAAFDSRRAPIIVPSGGKRWGERVEALAIAQHLERLGVPRDAIRPELSSLTTAENAAYSIALVERLVQRRPRLLVVTCSWHLARALGAFRRLGADVAGMAVEPPRPRRLVGWLRDVREAASKRLDGLAADRAGAGFGRYAADHLDAGQRVYEQRGSA
jgi:uncharacterized SAM-binding protein YcdF (DUF218 family)